ncbi:MAG: type II CRISPR RNA-guided endonuclease Cas9 [Bacteroidetes bacterium]|nr:type II CRISPR RNA-guided endonuclease Cas9 [Bacteroidota bacterium]MBS1648198.1 type II CRISPR RNA-guided endonuclease Cas9 [Bacteroidota bacterium]
MNKTILGLDLGTNSIGWALINQNIEENNGNIIKIGARIIPMSEDILGKFDSGITESDTAKRTGFRGIRRLRERHILRRERLHRVLNILGYLPEHYAKEIDFKGRLGQFLKEAEPKIPYRFNNETKTFEFIFKKSFNEMVEDFKKHQPQLLEDGKLIPYDWTIYYLRNKALTQKIDKEELAWLLLNFNQKRGYYQLRGEDEEDNADDKRVEFHPLTVTDVIDTKEINAKKQTLYKIVLENGWDFIKPSNIPILWKGKVKEFVVTITIDKTGKEKRTFRAPDENDWTLVKKKTEHIIYKSNKTVGTYIYDTLLQNPKQKINGSLVRVIERKFYKDELQQILAMQQLHHSELKDVSLYLQCIKELYEYNEDHRNNIGKKDFAHLFLNDIIFYQRPLKSKKTLISDCRYESRTFKVNGVEKKEAIKCIAKSHPLFQEFRLWQWMQNLRIYEKTTQQDVTSQFLQTEDDWVKLFDWLNGRKEVDHKALLNYLLKPLKLKASNYRWNYVYDAVKDESKNYPCNETYSQIVSRLAKVENIPTDFLTKEIEEKLWHIFYSVNDKNEIESALKKFALKYNLDEKSFVEQFKKMPPYKNEYGAYSAKAIKKLLPLMRMGKYWNENEIDKKTKERIGKIINAEYDENIKERVRDKAINLTSIEHFKGLPLWLTSYIVYDRHSEEGEIKKWKSVQDLENYLQEFKQHSLHNPIVEQVVTETLRVVKDIWNYYGQGKENYFDEIHIELGREMKNSADKRKELTNKITENENTNFRIKALLAELANDSDVENVRPYSPTQQEILKIYENGALNAEAEIPDDILKISKAAQPSKNDLIRYKLWLEQKYRSPYTGAIIPLNKLFTPAYEIEHIIPQSRFFDDSFSNKVICEAEVNKLKNNRLGLEFIKEFPGQKVTLNFGKTVEILTADAYEDLVKKQYGKSRSKMQKLLMIEVPQKFAERQINDTRYVSKMIKNLLSNIVREDEKDDGTTSVNVLSSNGQITSTLKQDWGLNDEWNEIIAPRFERLNALTNSTNFGNINPTTNKFLPTVPLELSKGFTKKRIDHRHHALDALVIACATRNHINYLNNQSALEKKKSEKEKQQKREDLRDILCYKKYNEGSGKNYKWMFNLPWKNFTKETKDFLNTTVVSFKQNLRVINKTVNKYQRWENKNGVMQKVVVKQTKGDSWAIRKPLHQDTVAGLVKLRFKKIVMLNVALDKWEDIVDNDLRKQIKELVEIKYDKKMLQKFFKDRKNIWNDKDISKVEIYYWDIDDKGIPKNVASRVKLDDTFNVATIESITDTGIQKILLNHLKQEKYQTAKDEKGKQITAEIVAFSADGIDDLNNNIQTLNNGKFHQPIYKVRIYKAKGEKFPVGQTGNKKDKYVIAAKGTNLFFAIYVDVTGKRSYNSIPFNEVLESQKQSAERKEKPQSVPITNDKGDTLLFHLSPNDLVYIPTDEERENKALVNFEKLTQQQLQRIYKVVSFTGNRLSCIPYAVAKPIVNKMEFTTLNKIELTKEKDTMLKLVVDRLGNIKI